MDDGGIKDGSRGDTHMCARHTDKCACETIVITIV